VSKSEDYPSGLTGNGKEIFIVFDVIDNRGTPREAREELSRRLHVQPPHRTTITPVFRVGLELFREDPTVLTDQGISEIIKKVGYGIPSSRVVELHRLYQLWKAHRRKETKEERPERGAVDEITKTFKGQFFTPAPENILIDDLGSLGDHSTRLRQDTLNVVLQSLGYTAGVKATVSTATWGAPRPREVEVFWSVSSSLLVERYCPVERNQQFQHWLASVPSTIKQDISEWKRLGGLYLAQCVQTRMKSHEDARQETRAWLAEGLIAVLPRVLPSPPRPLTVNFGNLIYQLAIEYCRSDGARGLPDESSYHTMPGDHPPFVKLVLGPTRIPLGDPLPGIVQTWIDLHIRMIVEWGQSREIGMLLYLFCRLQHIEETIKEELLPRGNNL